MDFAFYAFDVNPMNDVIKELGDKTNLCSRFLSSVSLKEMSMTS